MTVTIAGRGPELLGTVGLFIALSTIAIGLRCYCRVLIVKGFGLDDWSAVAAWALFMVYSTFALSGVHHGTGQHADDIPRGELPQGLKWWWACEPVYILTCMALKFSIGIFLLRIAVARTHKVIIWAVIIVTEVYSAFFFFLFILQCRPSSYFWTQYTGGKGTCINPKVIVDSFYAYSAISCAADWTLGIIPVFMVWNLQMNIRTKLSVAAILAVGAIASSATIIRIPYIRGMADINDFLYSTMDVAIWSTVEVGIGITASGAATLRPLFNAYFSSTIGGSGSGTTPSASNRQPQFNGRASRYLRSKDTETFVLRSDIGKTGGVTTVIEGDADLERVQTSGDSHDGNQRGWNDSESKLRDASSDLEDRSWPRGIVKTTGTIQVTN
ncbi:Uncharacterized protein BP5553_02444 [Venustampulla echinocandica]|uniref:Rhodopsin domain-containing protein n=1 Tax=Venustampulla echinocandica TaxID=2656787 RepID=A0A370U3W0_9HELO|nr:Uncharacterized protein BP5553_02444 [Venustampulla echinocandica]RDL42465.1 Uncharacterized protein BP5553_02444 [Venustampulla echinocandica]